MLEECSSLDDFNTRLFVISDDIKKYRQVISTFSDFKSRYNHVNTNLVSELYAAELNLCDLRTKVGI